MMNNHLLFLYLYPLELIASSYLNKYKLGDVTLICNRFHNIIISLDYKIYGTVELGISSTFTHTIPFKINDQFIEGSNK